MRPKYSSPIGVVLVVLLLLMGWISGSFAADVPKYGGTLKVVSKGIKTLDPVFATSWPIRMTMWHVFETLFAWDEKGEVHPMMVEDWKVSADLKTYTFTLRADLLFHDGRPVTVDDVIPSLKRWGEVDKWGKSIFKIIEAMEKVNDRTFTIKLSQPYGLLPKALGKSGSPVPAIMPKELAATSSKEPIQSPIGSGPYRVAEWKPGRHLILEKFKGYKPRPETANGFSGGKIAYLEKLQFLEIPEVATQMAALETGKVDMVPQVDYDQVEQLRKKPDIRVRYVMPTILEMLMFNKTRPPFDNVKMRRAVQMALNHEEILRLAVGSDEFFRVTPSIFFDGTVYESKAGVKFFNQADLKKAQAILKEAGGPPSKPIILMVAKDFPHHYNAALALKQALEQLGFKVDFQVYDWAALEAMRYNKDKWNVWAAGLSLDPNYEPATALWMDPKWVGWYESPRMQELSNRYFAARNPAEKKAIVDEMQTVFYDEVPFVKLGELAYVWAFGKNVKGFLNTEYPVFWNVWLDN